MFHAARWIQRALGIFALLCWSCHAYTADKVVLQLKWEHEFQFAGYYAALWEGYYKREGLEVEIRSAVQPDGRFVTPLEELTSGRAQFSIGGTDILVNKGRGYDLTVLAPIFQRSPGAIVSLKSTPMHTVEQASRLRLVALPGDDTLYEAQAMFFMNGVNAETVTFVDKPIALETLLSGEADALVTYQVSAQSRAQELGLELNSLDPADFGVQFYGDTLYTTGALARNQPELVERFLRATLDGWRYALEHKQVIARRITDSLPRHVHKYDDFFAYNMAFAQQMDQYTFYPVIDLGHVHLKRWQRTYDILDRLGAIERPYDPATLLFSPPKERPKPWFDFHWLLVGVSVVVLLLGVAFVSRKPAYGLPITALVALLMAEQGLEIWLQRDSQAQQSIRTVEALGTLRSRLEQVINRNLAELTGAAAFIAANPDLTQTEFDNYARNILKLDPQLINLAAAPDLVVKYIYPLPGNEAVLGLDYHKNEHQLPAILRAIEFNEPIVAGPVTLVQGGQALISRAPVRVVNTQGEHQLWGIVSAPIDVTSVYREAGLLDPALGIKVAIRGKDGRGKEGEVFYGREELFSLSDAVTQPVSFSGGAWQIAAVPDSEDKSYLAKLIVLRVGSSLVAVLIMLLLFSQTQRAKNQQKYQMALKRHSQFLHEVETVAKVGGWRMDRFGAVYELSDQAQNMLGIEAAVSRLSIDAFAQLFECPQGTNLAQELHVALAQRLELDIELQSKDKRLWLRLIADPLTDDDGHPEIVGAIQDITEKKLADAKIEYQANYDGLTDLPNRLLFQDRLHTAIARADRTDHKIALLFVDLDHFKTINDNYGHREGDMVLREAAERVQHCVRKSDTVGRHSGDEFTVILHDLRDENTASDIAGAMVSALSKAFKIRGMEVYSGASIGIALYPDDAKTPEDLIINADQAMYEVKKSGRNGWHFYTDEMQRKSEYRHQLHNALVSAINDNELTFHLQPIVCAVSGKTIACEALARWQRADGSWIPPDEFVPLAEETGLINQVDYMIMDKAVMALEAINATRTQPIALSVNVSPRLFQTKDRALDRWLARVRSASASLPMVVEITERLLTAESSRTEQVLHELANSGISISIDDFGTGYSSLSYLTRFPVNKLKIDRSFVNCIGTNSTSETLIETILVMAERLDIQVVAEGVETPEQLEYLKTLKCHSVQGYLLGRPATAEVFAARIREEAEDDRAGHQY